MTSTPTGTVTFLFTDIEGSTKRWEQYPQQMSAALASHDHTMRETICAAGGHVFKMVGDAFYAAFATPLSALAAAVSAQQALLAEGGPGLKVRMALHTGMVESRDGDYFGQPLNRVARLLSAAHGGQIVLSLATQDLVRDQLPASVKLLDLGEHRLKDLIRPERIYQVVAPGLPTGFPPLRTLESHPNNLPAQATPFIGREKELAAVAALLRRADVRLVTLTGPGGTGKTRLALQVATDLLHDFGDGVFAAELAALTDAGLVPSTIARTLGLTEGPGKSPLDVVLEYLSDRHMLLVLDNFEQVLDATPAVDAILRAAPNVKLLVTSRAELNLYGEHDFPVPPLTTPDIEHLPALPKLTQYEAVRLFIDRAQAARPNFEVTNENAPAVAEICVRLDGLPLAVELAAARVKLFPAPALLARLDSRLRLLTGGASNLPARHQTLRAAIAWSYDLLSEGEQQFFRRTAVFQGSSSLEALEAVCNCDGDLQVDVLDGVESLVSKSLLQQRERSNGEPRFRMLETIREYAREKLEESGEAEALCSAHAAYFLSLVEGTAAYSLSDDRLACLRGHEEDHDNFRRAIDSTVERARGGDQGAGETALWLVAVLEDFWRVQGYFSEGRARLEEALVATSTSEPNLARAHALVALARISHPAEDYVRTRTAAEEALAIARDLGDTLTMAWALFYVGVGLWSLSDLENGKALLMEALVLFRQLGDTEGIGNTLINLCEAARDVGELDEAKRLLEEALELCQGWRDKTGIAFARIDLGYLALLQGDYSAARSHFEAALAIYRDAGVRYRVLTCLDGLLDSQLVLGEYANARRSLDEALDLAAEMGLEDQRGVLRFKEGLLELAWCNPAPAGSLMREAAPAFTTAQGANNDTAAQWLAGMARVAAAMGDMTRAARLVGAVYRLRQSTRAPFWPLSRIAYEQALEAARAQLSGEDFRKAWDEGEAMSREQAIEYALEQG